MAKVAKYHVISDGVSSRR